MFQDYSTFIIFFTATITLNLIPGTDVMFIASQSLIDKRHGILAALGISVGICIYVLVTAFGVTPLIQNSSLVFNLIRSIGAVYLFYLAIKIFNRKETKLNVIKSKATKAAFINGIYTTLLNPKIGLFLLTFLPQFVDPLRGKVEHQLLTLGFYFLVSGTLINLLYALLFIQLRAKIFSKMHVQKWLDRFTAFVFCIIAFKILF
ncbi:TPA: LysE family translocator [Legionella pneumophila]